MLLHRARTIESDTQLSVMSPHKPKAYPDDKNFLDDNLKYCETRQLVLYHSPKLHCFLGITAVRS